MVVGFLVCCFSREVIASMREVLPSPATSTIHHGASLAPWPFPGGVVPRRACREPPAPARGENADGREPAP
jgi:hypothetical protein